MRNIYTVGRAVKTALLCLLAVIIMVIAFMGAVLQQSYRMYPPTDEEIADNPSLVIYRGE